MGAAVASAGLELQVLVQLADSVRRQTAVDIVAELAELAAAAAVVAYGMHELRLVPTQVQTAQAVQLVHRADEVADE